MKSALESLVRAWERLPSGHYSPREIERWLREEMTPAINIARDALARSERDKAPT